MKSILDGKFRYRAAATHADPSAFQRRQRARLRLAQRKAKADAAKVQPIKRRGAA